MCAGGYWTISAKVPVRFSHGADAKFSVVFHLEMTTTASGVALDNFVREADYLVRYADVMGLFRAFI